MALMALPAVAQAPLLQDGASGLRKARLDWVQGLEPLAPPSLPSLEVGWGGSEGGDPALAPLLGGEGMGTGTRGWGLGLQGRFTSQGWSISATMLGFRWRDHTLGTFQRGSLAYQAESGWRLALEQAPLAWSTGFPDGGLLGTQARPVPRATLTTPIGELGATRWQAEAFQGRLTGARPVPAWMPDRETRLVAQAEGEDLARPDLLGFRLRGAFGSLVEASLGTLALRGGKDRRGRPAPSEASRTLTLAELKVRLPSLAQALQARGVAVSISRSGEPGTSAITLANGRTAAGWQVVWEEWDLGFGYAGPSRRPADSFLGPSHLSGLSSRGDFLEGAFGPSAASRALEVGLPIPAEGRAILRLVRITAPMDLPAGRAAWFLQSDAQWRTPTGRFGASLASIRTQLPDAPPRWGWAFTVFQAFRVF